ncbi:MAG TPA: hypothetical protein DCG69_10785 [Bacteroidales bacterium]|nr:hypothetical protein [Bacteroidales bacterium]
MKKYNPKKDPNAYVKYSSIAMQMGLVIGIGVFGGFKLDKFLSLKFPIFTLFFSLASVALAIYLAIKDFIKK